MQIFGIKGSQASRAAERFFKERSVAIQFVDLKVKPMAPGEIKRFVDRFGLTSLLDVESKAYIDGGLKYLKLSEKELLGKIERNSILRVPPHERLGSTVPCSAGFSPHSLRLVSAWWPWRGASSPCSACSPRKTKWRSRS